MTLLAVLYSIAGVWLALYGLNALVLALLYLRARPTSFLREESSVPRLPSDPPPVTIQLPIYNERHVVVRLIDAVAALDYPRDRLQVQVLDDSDDETTALAARRIAYHQSRGVRIELVRRPDRSGYKAGALAYGLTRAWGEFIAVFDADFVPPPDFLKRTLPYFLQDPRLGMVQARWDHLNAEYSPLTRAQALALDGHFIVEQTARNRHGLLMNFNGTAGVWRRRCIEESGGWQTDTLSEDLDLSYRAQLAGWRCLYLPWVAVPAELPPQLAALKRQQFRWAKGSIQCLLKLTPSLLTSRLTLSQKIGAMLHLSSYLAHPLMLLLLLTALPLFRYAGEVRLPMAMAYLGFASLGPPLVYALAQVALHRDWPRRLAYFPLLALLGTGIALNNTQAALQALLRRPSGFARTPKFRLEGGQGRWERSDYRLSVDWTVVGEVLLSLYALLTMAVAWRSGNGYALPFLALYAVGFGLTAWLGVWQGWVVPARSRRRFPTVPSLTYGCPPGQDHQELSGR